MQFKHLFHAVGIAANIVVVAASPIVRLDGLGIGAHPSENRRDGISARSPEDIVPIEECKRALLAGSISGEALVRRCAGDDDGEVEIPDEGGGEENGDDDTRGDDENIEDNHVASNSPRQDCILTQMGLFPMPNFGICESLPDTPPTPNPALPVTPNQAPDTPPPPPPPQPEPAPAPALALPPVRKPMPINAGGPARAIPKRVIEDRGLDEVLA